VLAPENHEGAKSKELGCRCDAGEGDAEAEAVEADLAEQMEDDADHGEAGCEGEETEEARLDVVAQRSSGDEDTVKGETDETQSAGMGDEERVVIDGGCTHAE
jgi:hypothetical protein